MTAAYALDRKPPSFNGAVFPDCLYAVLAACRSKPAAWGSMRGDRILVEADYGGKQNLGYVHIYSS